ncbi:Uncharacterized protein GBIM_16242 [Gryllus bimaculatus]|nr:Uncharacterized protein GBIM_16242 [Gryllus bimaculatus]
MAARVACVLTLALAVAAVAAQQCSQLAAHYSVLATQDGPGPWAAELSVRRHAQSAREPMHFGVRPAATAHAHKRRVVSLETVQPDGQRWEVQMGAGDAPATWTPTGIYIVRTHTDYEVNETLKRRGDGTVALFKPNGDLVVSFPDGTQITSGPPPAPQPSRRVRKKSSEGASMVGSLSALTAGGSSVLRSIVSSRASPATSTPSAIASAAVSTRTTPGPPTPPWRRGRARAPGHRAHAGRRRAATPAHFTTQTRRCSRAPGPAQHKPVPRTIPAHADLHRRHPRRPPTPPARTTPTRGKQAPGRARRFAAVARARGRGPVRAGGVAKRVSVASPPEGLSAIEEEGASPSAHPLLPPEHLRLLADAERAARNAVLGRSGSSVTCFDHFEVLHSAYRIEHRNYATVEFDDTTGIVELKIPDATVQVFPDGTYHVQMPGDMHDLGDTIVTLEVGAEEIHMKHLLKESGELLCRNDIDHRLPGRPPPLAMDQVLCSTVDGVGRSFEVQYSGQSSYRRRGPGEHVVFSENARYFLVHRDLTGLELHTADALRRLIARTEEDRRSIYMSQVVVKVRPAPKSKVMCSPDLSYHVSLRPLLSESERWLLPCRRCGLSSYEFRKRARAVAAAAAAATSSSKAVWRRAGRRATARAPARARAWRRAALRSTYGVPPSWFHVSKSAREQLPGPTGAQRVAPAGQRQAAATTTNLTAHPGMELRERSAQRLEMREEARCDLSHVEHRRLSKRQARLSMVRPCWQEKTSSPAALNLYRLATHRRTSISMSVSEENLFQELRALLRLGRGPPYFETPAGRRFLEEDAAAHKAAAKAAARSKTLNTVGCATMRKGNEGVAWSCHCVCQEVGTVSPIALAPQIPTTPPTPTTPPPPPPCTTDKASFDSSHSSSSSSTVCKRCGSVCEHTKRAVGALLSLLERSGVRDVDRLLALRGGAPADATQGSWGGGRRNEADQGMWSRTGILASEERA